MEVVVIVRFDVVELDADSVTTDGLSAEVRLG